MCFIGCTTLLSLTSLSLLTVARRWNAICQPEEEAKKLSGKYKKPEDCLEACRGQASIKGCSYDGRDKTCSVFRVEVLTDQEVAERFRQRQTQINGGKRSPDFFDRVYEKVKFNRIMGWDRTGQSEVKDKSLNLKRDGTTCWKLEVDDY